MTDFRPYLNWAPSWLAVRIDGWLMTAQLWWLDRTRIKRMSVYSNADIERGLRIVNDEDVLDLLRHEQRRRRAVEREREQKS